MKPHPFSLLLHRNNDNGWSVHCLELKGVYDGPTPSRALAVAARAVEARLRSNKGKERRDG